MFLGSRARPKRNVDNLTAICEPIVIVHDKHTHGTPRRVTGTALILKNGVFWDVTPCGSCKNLRFGGT
jgi:hypothetical protein